MATGYAYRPLNNEENEIRLLVFENTDITAPQDLLKCYLQHESLRKAALIPDFHAVSYAWGDVTKRKKILVGGKSVSVPENAEAALRRFVTHHHGEGMKQDIRPRRLYFWIDAVCINHADQDERSAQLPLMNAIYTEAKTVMIWLGGDEDGLAEDAIQAVRGVVEQCRGETNDLADLFKRLWDTRARRLSIRSSKDALPSATNVTALRSLYSSRWFTRLWVVQEACLAKQAICFRGSQPIALFDVALAAQWMWYRGRGKLAPEDSPTSTHIIGIRNATEIWDCMATPYATPKLLWTILAMSMEFETTDPLDKIYGLYGIIELWLRQIPRMNFRPDYSVSQAKLYSIATRAAILDAGNLAILGIVSRATAPRPHGKTKDVGMPSWVPRFDWTIDRAKGSTCHIQPPMRGASNGDSVRLNQVDGLTEILTIEGLIVDEIKHTCQLGLSSPPAEDEPCYIGPNLASAWRLSLEQGSTKLCHPLEQAFAATLCAGQDTSFMPIFDSPEFTANSCNFFQSTTEKELLELGDRLSKLSSVRKDSGAVFWPDPSAYYKCLTNACLNRNFFVTANGRLGIGPKTLQPQDQVCIFPGSAVPLVLRKEGIFWRLVGDAYCFGIMDGRLYCELDAFGKRDENMKWFHIE